MYMTVKQAAEKWGISDRRVRILCAEGKISGAIREGRRWMIPVDTRKPADGRFKATESLLTVIDRKKSELDTRCPLTRGEAERLTEEFIIEYTYNSNAIEGNTLTLRETDMVLRGLTIDRKPLKDHMEAVGHKEAFDFVRDLVKEQVPLSESIIKQIHYLVLADKREDRGVYRRVPVRIMGAKHEPVQPYLIQPKMEQVLEDYRNNTDHIISRLARFHIEFEGIHPFIDAHVIIGTRLEKPSKINGFALLSPNFFMPERGERNHHTSTYIAGQQYESLIAIKATIPSADDGFEGPKSL